MTLAWDTSGAFLIALQRTALAALALAVLMSGFTGRAGVQVVDGAIAARLFALHLHGIAGEREYVEAHREPAPFVHGHCHAPLEQPAPQPGPYEVQAAASLAGAALCAMSSSAPAPPSGRWVDVAAAAPALPSRFLAPPLEPPR